MSIRKLPDDVVNKIAAGEILVRPMNAVKELVENSIDAGAKNITIVINGGGLTSIQIIDDGNSLHIIECNARIGGASTLAFYCGLISPIWSILEAQGLSHNAYPFNPNRNRIRMIRNQKDSFIDLGT